MSTRHRLLALTIGCVLNGLACKLPSPQRERAPNLSVTGASQTPLVLAFDGGLPPALASDALWTRASTDEPMYCAQLGQTVGAARLMEWLERGGKAGAVALCALVWSHDAHEVRGRMCELLERTDAPARHRVLDALAMIAEVGPRLGERLDADDDVRYRGCIRRPEFGAEWAPAERAQLEWLRVRDEF